MCDRIISDDPFYRKLCYMATHYLIKKKAHSFLTQQLNTFYPLEDSRSL